MDEKDKKNKKLQKTKTADRQTPAPSGSRQAKMPTARTDDLAVTINNDVEQGQEIHLPKEDDVITAMALALHNIVIFPYGMTPLVISEPEAIRVVEKAVETEQFVAFFFEMPYGDTPRPVDGIEFQVGTRKLWGRNVANLGLLGRVVKMLRFPDGTMRVLVRGVSRVMYERDDVSDPYLKVRVRKIISPADNSLETQAMVRNVIKQFQEVVSDMPNFPEEIRIALLNQSDNERITDMVADTLNISYAEKMAVLTMLSVSERLHLLTILLNREVEVLRLGSQIQTQVHNVLSKSQREYFLREQLKQIKNELGEGNRNPDIVSIGERMAKIKFPPEVKTILDKEVERLDMIPQASSEYNIAYTYVDWLLSVPWDIYTDDRLEVKEAARILDSDHYGLKDVKERILEYLSVLQLRRTRKAPIICFVGPPGVGKTSLGKSIASAMGREFIRISLGGVRDEAEVRGHRRTYIGALPGRIIQGMKRAGTCNPVFMLDELDKLSNDIHGDPASALLEVLDPAQNSAFNDHYLEVDYDLSSVMFIATANIEDTIPGPLRDRMEIIRLPGYTSFEKHEIARRYLIKRQMQESGLHKEDVSFTRGAVDEVISHYTMEAGVRNLERTFGKLCRKIARQIVEEKIRAGSGFLVTPEVVRNLLGPHRISDEDHVLIPRVGVATGMAWTSVGGSTLEVEATMMPGKGELRLTGSLGDVMKESAMTAFSYVRSQCKQLKINSKLFQTRDFHIHVPDGATPKDGPSAGVTLTTALVSLLTGKPVRPLLSMTGEITLRGKVTAIGGVREKVIAALRAGIRDIIMPAENEKDLEEVPEEVKSQIQFHFVSEIAQVLTFAIPPHAQKALPRKPEGVCDPNEVYVFDVSAESVAAKAAEEKVPAEPSPSEKSAEDEVKLKKIQNDLKSVTTEGNVTASGTDKNEENKHQGEFKLNTQSFRLNLPPLKVTFLHDPASTENSGDYSLAKQPSSQVAVVTADEHEETEALPVMEDHSIRSCKHCAVISALLRNRRKAARKSILDRVCGRNCKNKRK